MRRLALVAFLIALQSSTRPMTGVLAFAPAQQDSDAVRACARYMRAIEEKPPDDETERRFYELYNTLTDDERRTCDALAKLGPDRGGFRPVRFELEPGHWITIDLLHTAISYQGRDHRVELDFALRDARYLPIQHTELTVVHPTPSRRHFIEIFFWLPDRGRWGLNWGVLEVVGAVLHKPDIGDGLTVSDSPTADVDVRRFARLDVNEHGRAEAVVQRDSFEEHRVIATAAEKRDLAERDQRRRDAAARVDRKSRYDETRAPGFTYSDQDGCGHVALFAWSDNHAEILTFFADKEALGLSAGMRTFDLATHPLQLRLEVLVYARAQDYFGCSDIRSYDDAHTPVRTWKAVAGTATIYLSPLGTSSHNPLRYQATVQITGAIFVNDFGRRVSMPQPITLTALVGQVFG
jgi:hypothetical protein